MRSTGFDRASFHSRCLGDERHGRPCAKTSHFTPSAEIFGNLNSIKDGQQPFGCCPSSACPYGFFSGLGVVGGVVGGLTAGGVVGGVVGCLTAGGVVGGVVGGLTGGPCCCIIFPNHLSSKNTCPNDRQDVVSLPLYSIFHRLPNKKSPKSIVARGAIRVCRGVNSNYRPRVYEAMSLS
jgi:hypothetical protein